MFACSGLSHISTFERPSTLGKCKAIVQHFFVLFFNYTCANTCVPVFKKLLNVCILSAGRVVVCARQANGVIFLVSRTHTHTARRKTSRTVVINWRYMIWALLVLQVCIYGERAMQRKRETQRTVNSPAAVHLMYK
jgi:hypothetical protein